jgi:hypothetical protein
MSLTHECTFSAWLIRRDGDLGGWWTVRRLHLAAAFPSLPAVFKHLEGAERVDGRAALSRSGGCWLRSAAEGGGLGGTLPPVWEERLD